MHPRQALVKMSKRPHRLVQYEQICEDPSLINNLAHEIGLDSLGEQRLGLESVPQ